MKEPFCHDIRSVLAAPGKALSLKSIFAASLILLAGYIIYSILTYIALVGDGGSFEYIWANYGIFPIDSFAFHGGFTRLIHLTAIVVAVFSFSLALIPPAVITFEQMRGDYFYSAMDAIKFTISRIPTIILAYLSIAGFLVFVYLLGLLIGLIGRIPFLGELLIGVFYLVPIFITLLFTVFIIFVAAVSIILLPIIIASQREKEVFDALLQLFSVVIKEPVRFIWYLLVSSALAKAASFVLAYFVYQTVLLSRVVLRFGGGQKIDRMFNAAFDMLPVKAQGVKFMTTLFPGVPLGFSIASVYRSEHSPGSILLGISIFLLFVGIIGYTTAVLSVGLARGYAVIRRMKDDYFIIEEEPLVPRDDYANPRYEERSTKDDDQQGS